MIGGMFILFLVLLLLNVPIAFSLGASSLFYLLTSNMNAAVLAQKFYAGIDSFTLLCIPGFMLAGALMNGGGITRRILNFVIGLHRSAVFKECEALDRATERAFDNADQQKQVVTAEQRRLEDMRLDAMRTKQQANEAWRKADEELAQFPVRP